MGGETSSTLPGLPPWGCKDSARRKYDGEASGESPPNEFRTDLVIDTMNPIVFAMRRPMTVMVGVVAVALGSLLAVGRMSIDIFPNLNLPVVYVSQPYGGMDPAQMEGLLTNYYEYHFLY